MLPRHIIRHIKHVLTGQRNEFGETTVLFGPYEAVSVAPKVLSLLTCVALPTGQEGDSSDVLADQIRVD